jgi:hypothetical protein
MHRDGVRMDASSTCLVFRLIFSLEPVFENFVGLSDVRRPTCHAFLHVFITFHGHYQKKISSVPSSFVAAASYVVSRNVRKS